LPLPLGKKPSHSLLSVLRFAKTNKLEERAFEPVREGWLLVTKLGEEGSCGDFDGTEQRLRSKGGDQCVIEGCQLFDRQIIHIIEEVGVEAAALLSKLQGAVSDTLHVPESLPGAAASHGGAGVHNVVPCKACFACPVRYLKITSSGCIDGIRNAARAVEHHPRRAPYREPLSLLESKIQLQQVLEQEAAQERLSERRLEVVHYWKDFVQVPYPIARNRRQFFVAGDDDLDVDIGPAIALTRKRAYDGNAVDAVIVAQQAGYPLGSMSSLFGRK
jgi:hypothetical protein